MNDVIAWELLVVRTRIHRMIDARADKAHAVVAAMAERDRRSVGQLTRMDRVLRRIK